MRKELKSLPKQLQEAYKKVPKRPDDKTPAVLLNIYENEDDDTTFVQKVTNKFDMNKIVNWIDPTLLDLDLDEEKGQVDCYMEFAVRAAQKVMFLTDVDSNKVKELEFYSNNPKVRRLKTREFTEIGDLAKLSPLEIADEFATFYGVIEEEGYKALSNWEKKLFAELAENKTPTSVEKNS